MAVLNQIGVNRGVDSIQNLQHFFFHLFLVIFHTVLVTFYSLLIISYSLLDTFCSLVFHFYSLLITISGSSVIIINFENAPGQLIRFAYITRCLYLHFSVQWISALSKIEIFETIVKEKPASSKMELFVKIIGSTELLIIPVKSSVLDEAMFLDLPIICKILEKYMASKASG